MQLLSILVTCISCCFFVMRIEDQILLGFINSFIYQTINMKINARFLCFIGFHDDFIN